MEPNVQLTVSIKLASPPTPAGLPDRRGKEDPIPSRAGRELVRVTETTVPLCRSEALHLEAPPVHEKPDHENDRKNADFDSRGRRPCQAAVEKVHRN